MYHVYGNTVIVLGLFFVVTQLTVHLPVVG